jgi:hypothetical protein
MHNQKTDMVAALLQHVQDTEKLSALRSREEAKLLSGSSGLSPTKPVKPRPSREAVGSGRSPFKMENICGHTVRKY